MLQLIKRSRDMLVSTEREIRLFLVRISVRQRIRNANLQNRFLSGIIGDRYLIPAVPSLSGCRTSYRVSQKRHI